MTRTQAPIEATLPGWVEELLPAAKERELEACAGVAVSVREQPPYRLVTARVGGAAGMEDGEFKQATIDAYGEIARAMQGRHAVRIWNFIPDIHRVGGGGLDRYMVFNVGRFEACRRWLGDDYQRRLPAASGVGNRGEDLLIAALGADVAGVAVENPRQVAAYRYSRRFGPKPPCFARATKTAEGTLLVGGTASVRGEESMHQADLAAQLDETIENLASVARAGHGAGLESFTDLRVYHPRRADGAEILKRVRRAFGNGVRVERVAAELCRRELLVEIEGVARVG